MNQQVQYKKSNSRYIQQNLLTSLSFSYDGKYCCMSTKKNIKLLIFQIKNIQNIDQWILLQQIHDQTQPISAIDWSKDNKIISGSHDRSVYIYQQKGKHWQKMLVNIDIKLSILCIQWAPSCKKFALGASCNTLALGFFNMQSNCWTASTRDKLCKSPIITLSFHPSSNILAFGCTDNSIKIVSCSFKSSKQDSIVKSNIQDNNYSGPFANVNTIYDVLFSIDNVGGWVNHVSFQENGYYLLVLPHTNCLKMFEIFEKDGNLGTKQTDIRWNGLPFLSGYTQKKGSIIYAGGFDKKVAIFTKSSQGYTFNKFLQINQKSSKKVDKRKVFQARKEIQKKGALDPSMHLNPIKVLPTRNGQFVVSYDVNGGIHFWRHS